MRLVNVGLCIAMCLVLAAASIEGGLRLIGLGPQPTINRFDPNYGWVKTPGAEAHKKSSEFDVEFKINELGLRDDPMPNPGKPLGVYRVVMLGDSFVLGYTVDRSDLFVDLLETWWRDEGRNVDVINAGTEGWSTDQEVLWFLRDGRNYAPDLVVLCPYENDLYWNGKTSYLRYPKPRFTPSGEAERRTLIDPGPTQAWEHWATGRLIHNLAQPRAQWAYRDPESGRERKGLEMEHGAYFHDSPEFMKEAVLRTRGALLALKNMCEAQNILLRVAPIPNKACIEEGARKQLTGQIRVDPKRWSPDRPVDTVLDLCRELSIPALDARSSLRARAAEGESLYYQKDWHLNPAGNRAFASFLHDALDANAVFPAPFAAQRSAEMAAQVESGGIPGWLKWYLALLTVLSCFYALTYRDEPMWQAPLKVGAMLAIVFAIAIGGSRLLAMMPAKWSLVTVVVFVAGLLMFILYKLGRRLGTIAELFAAFTRRGHWYLMPLVIVLLTIGSLLVVAASSPLVAPFIYTLF